jgi:Bacterial protein of unknown function (DUF916)./Protein of unknown function C-terminal (DUF3324).
MTMTFKRVLRPLFMMLSILIVLLFSAITAYAVGTTEIAIAPVYPDNQITENGIFNLKVTPGQKETIKLKIANLSKENQRVTVQPTTSYTADSGVLSIDRVKTPKTTTAPVKFSNIVREADHKKTVIIPANEIVEVPFTFMVPKKPFEGVVVGGLLVKSSTEENPLIHKGVSVKNKFAYTMSVVLKEEVKKAEPDLKLGAIKAGRVGTDIKVNSVYKNIKPAVVSDMTVNAVITTKGDGRVMGKTTQTGMSMAPNSGFKFTNNWDKKTINPGTYHYKANVQTADGHHWTLETDFKVDIADAVVINDHYNPWIKWIILATILVIMILVIWYYIHRKKKVEQNRVN